MNRALPLLLGLALGGCAMGTSPARHPHGRYRSSVGAQSVSTDAVSLRVRTSSGRAHRSPSPIQPSPPPTAAASRSPGRSPGHTGSRYRGGLSKTKRAGSAVAPAGTTAGGASLARGAKIPRGRLVIYQGTLVLRVFKLSDAVDLAQKLSLETGAYISSQTNNRMVIRVPVGRFHELFARLAAVGEVASKSISARDVTRQYYDITFRLKAAKVVLARLQSLLQKARNVKESLAIEREMSRLLTRIEGFKGMLRYLQHHASLSTINIYFRVKPRYYRRIRPSERSPFRWVRSLGLWRMMRY